MSVLRLSRVTREVGTFVILDAIDAAIAVGDRIGLVGPNGAGKTTLLRLAAGRDEPDLGEVHRKRGLSIGLLAQEAHFDEAFMAAADLRDAVRTGAAHLDRMAEALARTSAMARWPTRGTPPSSMSTRSSAGTRSTSVSTPRSVVSALRESSGPSRHRRCRAGSRPGRHSPGWSSRTPTCSFLTSRPTTSISMPSNGSRSTSGVVRGPSSWRPTTGHSSTRR